MLMHTFVIGEKRDFSR